MAKVTELNKLLTDCFEQLVECAHLVKEIPVDPHSKNVYRLGKAMAEISDVMGELYEIHPELKPEKWGVSLQESDYKEMYEDAVVWANEYIQADTPEKAVEVFEQYIVITPYENLREMAEKKVREVKIEFAL